ncbi:hypothetical protein BC829DRAFT_210096 [Chytridium lagenaria]|nr:hypothetical protein BC829DRAFT_210096 [Chytridium lagenaria]
MFAVSASGARDASGWGGSGYMCDCLDGDGVERDHACFECVVVELAGTGGVGIVKEEDENDLHHGVKKAENVSIFTGVEEGSRRSSWTVSSAPTDTAGTSRRESITSKPLTASLPVITYLHPAPGAVTHVNGRVVKSPVNWRPEVVSCLDQGAITCSDSLIRSSRPMQHLFGHRLVAMSHPASFCSTLCSFLLL